jgi:hypothetical protein
MMVESVLQRSYEVPHAPLIFITIPIASLSEEGEAVLLFFKKGFIAEYRTPCRENGGTATFVCLTGRQQSAERGGSTEYCSPMSPFADGCPKESCHQYDGAHDGRHS